MKEMDGLYYLDDSFDREQNAGSFLEGTLIPHIEEMRNVKKLPKRVLSSVYLGKELGSIISFPGDITAEVEGFFDEKFRQFDVETQNGVYSCRYKIKPYSMKDMFNVYQCTYMGLGKPGSLIVDTSLKEKAKKVVEENRM